MTPLKFEAALLRRLPKVLLPEHLDGALRPRTIVELAKEAKYSKLPTQDPEELAEWFFRGANQGSLAKYLEGFAHTIAVMQTEAALERQGVSSRCPNLWSGTGRFGKNQHQRDEKCFYSLQPALPDHLQRDQTWLCQDSRRGETLIKL
ncbi:MAG: hypothetical protein DMG05_00155 [Acidobacteria bacterium]|nr:MAG: hypothetical protein DMG05_00155 [Acidobacteriota bacterium]